MKKWKATILSLLTITAATTLTAAVFCAQKTPVSALADTPQGEILVTPSSYEEYLSLTAPTDVAATDGYVAIADGRTLFLFDRDRNAWQEYTHANPITKIDFGSRDELYFLDGQTNKLYVLNVKTFDTPVETGIFCSTFSIQGANVYSINVSAGITSIYQASLSDLTTKKELYAGRMYSPSLSYWNGEVYYVYGTDFLYKLDADNTPSKVADLPVGVISLTITEGVVCLATEDGGFYAYNLVELAEKQNVSACEPLAAYTGTYSAVSDNGNNVYLVAGDKIEKFSLIDKALADYSIGATSSAPNRFDGASEVTLAGDKLFIADDNNDRISVYDVNAKAFLPSIPCQLNTPIMAAYGDSLFVSTASHSILYSLRENTYGETLYSLTSDRISGNVVGAAAVYDNYYLVTDTNYCYTLTATDEGYTHTETLRKAHFAEKLAADINGNLYVLTDGEVYRYTEENFLSQKEEGVKICEDIPGDVSKLSVDYAGNLYALSQNTLYRYAPQDEGLYALQSTTAFTGGLVYGGGNEVLSFTFGIEDNAVYFLYKDNYLTVTDSLGLPTLKNIPTERIGENIFGEQDGEFTVVQTLPNSFIVEVDGSKLQDAATFPYLSSYRSKQSITALKIGETTHYAVLVYRENKADDYKTVLIEKSRQAELDSDYKKTEGYPQTGYLTNLTKAYKFPCMGLPTLGQMDKNTQVTLLYEVNGLDCEYYAVAYGEQTAFVPKANVLFFDGTPPVTESVTIGDASKNESAMWRLAYLILGSAAICILIDTLILRKKNKND
jgi:hypothetical protein